ncbi:MAG: hypothetical protein M1421_00170 [Candidatus Eremiobacteraeota bacterium]|nr:hypothetical protein [Candidatus Eremiobacteraeota bacterium]MCL5056016.1 hypothetical protein [Bacillota bacterium]
MKKVFSARKFFLFILAGILLTGVLFAKTPVTGGSAKAQTSKKSTLKKQTYIKMTTPILLKKMADALGGLGSIQKIKTLYFKFGKIQVNVGNPSGGQVLQLSMGNTEAKEWMTSDGNARAEVRSTAMFAPPILVVLSNGQQTVKIPVTVTSSSQYWLPAPGGNCSKSSNPPKSSNPLCVNLFSIKFNLGYYKFHTNASPRSIFQAREENFTGTLFESDTCNGIAEITPSSVTGGEGSFTVVGKHPGKCLITIASDSPQGWMLAGDQGLIGTSSGSTSTGQMSGPDLERRISWIYWQTFAYLTSGGIPGKVSYQPTGGTEYLLKMNPDGGEPITAYINKKTFLPDKVQIGDNTDPGREMLKVKTWKTVDGVKFPSEMIDEVNNPAAATPGEVKYIFKKIKANLPAPKKLFQQPTPAI